MHRHLLHCAAPSASGLNQHVVRFTFDRHVPMDEVRGTLKLAQLAAEALHGQDRVSLEASCTADVDARTVQIQTQTEVGRTLAAVFLGYARREFGSEAFHFEQVAEVAS